MSKVSNYLIFVFGLTILMKMAGVPYGGEEILNWIGLDITNIYVTTSYFFLAIIGIFTLSVGLGAVLSNRESSIRAGLAIAIMGVGVSGMVGILNYVNDVSTGNDSWVYSIVFLILSVYIIGFIMAMVDWWGGTG